MIPQGRKWSFVVGSPTRAGAGKGMGPSRLGFGGCAPPKNSQLITFKSVFKLSSQLILNTECNYSVFVICGYMRGCKLLLLNLLKFVIFETPESLFDY